MPRIPITKRRRQGEVEIPAWKELSKLDAAEVEALADSLGIEYTSRAKTLSAINKAR